MLKRTALHVYNYAPINVWGITFIGVLCRQTNVLIWKLKLYLLQGYRNVKGSNLKGSYHVPQEGSCQLSILHSQDILGFYVK